jgi:hypothetical protein
MLLLWSVKTAAAYLARLSAESVVDFLSNLLYWYLFMDLKEVSKSYATLFWGVATVDLLSINELVF